MSEQQARCAQDIIRVMSQLSVRQSNLCFAALAGAQHFKQWQHYPANDATDATHGTEFYYHAHAEDMKAFEEHGHFHVFARTRRNKAFHHVVGISLSDVGMPVKLFLTNRWVTGETWVDAAAIEPLVHSFVCERTGRLAPVARWITAMVSLYGDDIMRLHHRRDRWLQAQLARGRPRDEILEARRHQVVASMDIDLVRRLARVQ